MTVTAASPVVREALPLVGFTVGVTAARRAEELIALLERRGATVLHGPAIRIVPLADDEQLLAATLACIRKPPDVVVATTGIGFRGWAEAADGWALGEELMAALRPASLLARGPKARGAMRAAGLPDPWSPASESSTEVLERLLAQDLTGVRVAVQLHGATASWQPVPDIVDTLRCAGADVVPVPVYRWTGPDDPEPLARLVGAVCARTLDAVTFTSAPAVAGTLAAAEHAGVRDELLAALRTDVAAMCVGPVTSAPLDELGVPTYAPARSRLGALVREVVEVLPRRSRVFTVAGHRLQVRGSTVVVDDEVRAVPPAGLALLKILARRPGRVVTRGELLAGLPGGGSDAHAVETAVARLRSALGAPELVQTVVKRGYRLATDVSAETACHDD